MRSNPTSRMENPRCLRPAERRAKKKLTGSYDFLDGLAERVDLLECRVDVRSYANALELRVDDRNDDDAMLLPETARDRFGGHAFDPEKRQPARLRRIARGQKSHGGKVREAALPSR